MPKTAQQYLDIHPWKIIETGFHPQHAMVSESVFSLGNEYMGVRGYFEEGYGGEHLRGSYFNGIFEDQPWPQPPFNGPPRRTHYMTNSVDWLYTRVFLDDEQLDLHTAAVTDFTRELDLRNGTVRRQFVWTTGSGRKLRLVFERFVSMHDAPVGGQRITAEALNFSGTLNLRLGLDFNTTWGEDQRNLFPQVAAEEDGGILGLIGQTENTRQRVAATLRLELPEVEPILGTLVQEKNFIGYDIELPANQGQPASIDRIAVNTTEKDNSVPDSDLWQRTFDAARDRAGLTYDRAVSEHSKYWEELWEQLDVSIEGDPANQQGVRFCIFQLHQTYHGVDPRLNVAAKGLTGEEYWGHTWWDTETYCLPFYIFNNPAAARNLLTYRYNTLPQACERAEELDCEGARYPMSTIDGTEACTVWQHGDLEIHCSVAVGYGIWHYINVTNDTAFLHKEGIEMLLQICRYYASRGQWSPLTGEFGLWLVMGPDEFHMAVHNNCYTNYMVKRCFEYTIGVVKHMQKNAPDALKSVTERVGLRDDEIEQWQAMADKMRIPQDADTGVYEQHDGYFDLPHIDYDKIPEEEIPLYKNWCYYRILRWDMIKQPDVLLMQFLHNHEFSPESKRTNYEYYEPRCSHESSLSPGIHSILAAELDMPEKALGYWGHAARMDLDNYNRNSDAGLHTTSMAAAWMNLVYGFGGMRSDGPVLSFKPTLPDTWEAFSFRVLYRDRILQINVSRKGSDITLLQGDPLEVELNGERTRVSR